MDKLFWSYLISRGYTAELITHSFLFASFLAFTAEQRFKALFFFVTPLFGKFVDPVLDRGLKLTCKMDKKTKKFWAGLFGSTDLF